MNEMMAPFRHPMLHMQPAMANFVSVMIVVDLLLTIASMSITNFSFAN